MSKDDQKVPQQKFLVKEPQNCTLKTFVILAGSKSAPNGLHWLQQRNKVFTSAVGTFIPHATLDPWYLVHGLHELETK